LREAKSRVSARGNVPKGGGVEATEDRLAAARAWQIAAALQLRRTERRAAELRAPPGVVGEVLDSIAAAVAFDRVVHQQAVRASSRAREEATKATRHERCTGRQP
jgi:hypothetical protein